MYELLKFNLVTFSKEIILTLFLRLFKIYIVDLRRGLNVNQKTKTWARIICILLAAMFVIPSVIALIASNF